MLGFGALGAAALGTDGASLADTTPLGVFASAAAGAVSGNNVLLRAGAAFAAGAVGTLSVEQSFRAAGAASVCAVAGVAATTASADVSVVSAAAVGAVSSAIDSILTGAVGTSAVGTVGADEARGLAGVSGMAPVASIAAGVGAVIDAWPITSDGVLGLWTLGDAAIGVDVPDLSSFAGVGSECAVGGQIDAGGSGVACTVSAGVVTASISDSTIVSGVAVSGSTEDLADSLQTLPAGVSATGVASPFLVIASIGQVAAVGAVGSCRSDENFDAPGVFALGSAGAVSVTSIPGISIVGVAATGMAGHLRSLSPSSAIALWGTPVAGGAVTLAFAGLTGVAVTIGTGQTLAQVAGALAAAVNGNVALMAAGVSARSVANVLTIRQPQPATISASLLMTGT
jgi:hypothetical protein